MWIAGRFDTCFLAIVMPDPIRDPCRINRDGGVPAWIAQPVRNDSLAQPLKKT
jgi:hypothetical protein